MGPATPYKLRTLVRQFKIASPGDPAVTVLREELECGHIVYGRTYELPGSKAVAIRDLFRELAGKPVKRRCFECAKPVR